MAAKSTPQLKELGSGGGRSTTAHGPSSGMREMTNIVDSDTNVNGNQCYNREYDYESSQRRQDTSIHVDDFGVTDANENANDSGVDRRTRRVLFGIKAIIGFVLFVIVLACTVLSKVTLVSMTDELRNHMWALTHANGTNTKREDRGAAAVLYWRLLFVMILPSFVTFLRSFFFGVFGKTRKSFPWPKPKAILMVSACG